VRKTWPCGKRTCGQRFGDWVTTGTAPIGRGGNGEVWAVKAADGRHEAIKVLHGHQNAEGVYRLGRFKDEIGFLIAHPDFPGILPLLDSQVCADPSARSWYVMPVAIPIRHALGNDPEPGVVGAAVAEIAGTLEALAAEGVAHRDIKPDNLRPQAWGPGGAYAHLQPNRQEPSAAPGSRHGRARHR